MKIAVISDIHGNADALRAVLDDIGKQNTDAIFNLGDHFSGPLDAAGTWALLKEIDAIHIRGNHDRYMVEKDSHDMGASDHAATLEIPQEALDWLRELAPTVAHPAGVFLCHGTPICDETYLLDNVHPDGLLTPNSPEAISENIKNIEQGLILCGHSHITRLIKAGDKLILNAGSVGLPAYDDENPHHVAEAGHTHAQYAIIEPTNLGWIINARSIPYDASRMIKIAKSKGREDWAVALETGRMS